MFNIKAMCFNKLDDLESRFEKISKSAQFKDELFPEFLKYFEDTWIRGRPFYPRLWNFYEGN